MKAIAQESTQRMIAHAQVPRGEGGKMRVDTGFLRASLVVGVGAMPGGATRGDPNGSYAYNEAATILALQGLVLGQTIYGGWTANYARPREAKDGFLRSAALQWGTIVNQVTAEVRVRIK